MLVMLGTAGALLLAVAAFCFWSAHGDRKSGRLMRDTATTGAADVAKLPPGTQVEVKGKLRCAAPLTGEFSGCACAYFRSIVEREYISTEYDHQKKRPKRSRRTQIMQERNLFSPFEVEDESGRVTVLPEGASVEGVLAVERFEAYGEKDESLAAKLLRSLASSDETIGFRYRETHIPLDTDIYVLGVTTTGGAVAAPPEGAKGQAFIVSVKSEEAMTAQLAKSAKWTFIVGLLSLGLALASIAGAFYVSQKRADPALTPAEQPVAPAP